MRSTTWIGVPTTDRSRVTTMPRKKATDDVLRGKCRHCGGALIYVQPDEKVERWGDLVYRSDRPRWWHLNPVLPEAQEEVSEVKQVNDSIFEDSNWGYLGAYCPVGKYEDPNERGQAGEPVEYCVVLKGDWPRVLCLNPVQDTDLFMCGVHAKKERERIRLRDQRQQEVNATEAHQDGSMEVCKRILDNWGLHTQNADYRWKGWVKVDHEELEGLLESLEEEYKLLQKRRARA